MDAFFAAVEQTLHPEYRGKALIVGGSEARGVVCAASYEARKFGVHSAMPLWKARQLCPHGLYVPVNGPACAKASRQAMEIYQQYTPRLDPISIDEACLDVTGSQKLFGPPEQIARDLQQRIADELGLSVSIGIGPNRLLAKMASDWNKPHGLTVVTADQLPGLLAPLAVRQLWGIGPVTAERLAHLGISTIGQLQGIPLRLLEKEFGQMGRHLHRASHGLDDTPVPIYDGKREYKQMSEETTLARDTRDVDLLALVLLRLCDDLTRRLRREGYQARTITLKIKLEDFESSTRSVTLPSPTDTEHAVYEAAEKLLRGYKCGARRVRLIGVAASNLLTEHTPEQLSLFGDGSQRYRQLSRARDRIIGKFGKQAIERASLLGA
jgi:nucleotidyltransferase/DNA polymerase involved in DNA repair